MPITAPPIDDRRFQDLVRDALARVPVHTPEYTQLAHSDPGVTLVELFAFLTESLLYRSNRIPEMNRLKFLSLLGLPLAPATPARGLVVLNSKRPEPRAETVPARTELRAGDVAFRTVNAIDVLPVEARAYVKFAIQPDDVSTAYYRLLYAAAEAADPEAQLGMYETRALDGRQSVDLTRDTVDGVLWLALLAPKGAAPNDVRDALAGRALSLGLMPYVDDAPKTLGTQGQGRAAADGAASSLVRYEMPAVAAAGGAPAYQQRPARSSDDVLAGPGVVEIVLPAKEQIRTWNDLDPLEAGVGDRPPAIEDSADAARVLTWLRIVPSSAARARFLWAGINAVNIDQRIAVVNELLGEGDGRTDQTFRLAGAGVVADSVRLDVVQNGQVQRWSAIDDLLAAGPEVRALDPRRAPGQEWQDARPSDVFTVDPEAGLIRFGDGLRGRRPPPGARLVAQYDRCDGARGNVAAGAIKSGPALPPGIKPENPLPTWGGADAEPVDSGEKRITNFIRHHDRLVTADDFAEISRRAPGVDIARIEVLAAYHPDLGDSEPGDAPGVVTLLLVPRNDPRQPDAPSPDRAFLDALCRYLDPRRLVTTELVLRGPDYVPIWLSLGITVAGGFATPDVRDRVKRRLTEYLAPARDAGFAASEIDTALSYPGMENGWPLRRAVNRLELMAEASREPGVLKVEELILARDAEGAVGVEVSLRGLQLPHVVGLSVEAGSAIPLDALRGTAAPVATPGRRIVPVPVVPGEC
ncbi:putative baseplate assembly protein [Caballeronia novacaledonica]|uniref:baseplate J/gp47 family protein n=1 Tax=Caballeronia novacaledonica TaxID=1544861 RepID=UPI001EE3516F|nr:baseplate J/gp47 family protein [Caballeronia novacaledonica]GJH13041.1 putative baseplate assembly protein [Caballeronia novacaledonica]